jgi:hypothetical protein
MRLTGRESPMRSLLAMAVLVFCLSFAWAADGENPFKNAHVGDWVEYQMVGPGMDGKTKMTIVAKDEKEVTYEITAKVSFMGKEMVAPVQKQKVDLTKPYDAIASANMAANNTKIEKLGEGTQKLKIGQKEYDTKWTELKSTTDVNGMMIVSNYKMWFAKNVPVSGLVRMETSVANTTTKVEIIGSGTK